ncbi:uncharacterized protein [Onthophagus taurus]|uniref:uncharacterized protein n=1 Tax=Onthophagus taurus TaxID=166361 RepID=UPI000C20452A|nr:uncharacterized protein LOC111425631 [Onthophagus taurus]
MSNAYQPDGILRKHVYLETKYRLSGPQFLANKLIKLTEHSALNVSVYQEEVDFYPPDEEVDPWCNIPMSVVTYTMVLKEVVNDIETNYNGTKLFNFETIITNYNRFLIGKIKLKDVLKEENVQYTNFEVDIELIITERSPHIYRSLLVVVP